MKAYVTSCQTDEVEGWLLDIHFGVKPSPECQYSSRTLAQIACCHLNHFVISRECHHCSFAVDELPDGSFGIFCLCHPF